MLHDGCQVEPKRVQYVEVIVEADGVLVLIVMPFVRRETADQEHDYGDTYVGQNDAEPNLRVKRLHEAENSGFLKQSVKNETQIPGRSGSLEKAYLFLWLFNHDTDTNVHEWHRELNDTLSLGRYGQRRHGNIGLVSD